MILSTRDGIKTNHDDEALVALLSAVGNTASGLFGGGAATGGALRGGLGTAGDFGFGDFLGLAGLGLNAFGMANNYAQQQADRDYMKWAQQITWDREDNAVQRRVADMRAAGLSPTLAAGNAASSSAPVRLTVPQFPEGMGNQLMGALTSMMAFKNAEASLAKNQSILEMMELQKEKLRIDNEFRSESNPLTTALKQVKLDYDEGTLNSRIKMTAEKLQTEELRQENILWDTRLEAAGVGRAIAQTALDWVRGRLYQAWTDEANRKKVSVDEYIGKSEQEKLLMAAEIEVKKALADKYKAEADAARYAGRDRDTLDWKDFLDMIK